jgi:DNA-binding IclR family transcriptional regulator
VAWEPAPVIEEWIARHRPPATEQEADQYRRMAATVRARGFSVTLTSPAQLEFEKAVTRVSLDLPTPEQTRAIRAAALQVGADGQDPEHLAGDGAHLVNSLAVPVRGADQRVQLALMLIGVNRALSAHEIEDWGARLSVAAMVATAGDPEPELIRYQANA